MKPIREIGSSRKFTVMATYEEITSALGPPNATDMDDQVKVKASWGFADDSGRKGFVWCYRVSNPESCSIWSGDGDQELLREVFGEENVI
jgi:hypothetical protein